jgi:hypothetical protein
MWVQEPHRGGILVVYGMKQHPKAPSGRYFNRKCRPDGTFREINSSATTKITPL